MGECKKPSAPVYCRIQTDLSGSDQLNHVFETRTTKKFVETKCHSQSVLNHGIDLKLKWKI